MKLKPGVEIIHKKKKHVGQIPDEVVKDIEKTIDDEKDFKSWKKKFAYDSKRDGKKADADTVKDEPQNSGN